MSVFYFMGSFGYGELSKKSCLVERDILPMNMNTYIIIVCLNNSYYPKIYADIFCMDFCCNSPLLGRRGVRENEIF